MDMLPGCALALAAALPLGLYTVLPSPYHIWCMAYKRGVGERAYIAQWLCNSIAIG